MGYIRKRREARRARALADQIIRNQVLPQVQAAKLREQGVDVETVGVYTGPGSDGDLVEVTCIRCRRKGKVPPGAVPTDKAVMCARCMAHMDGIIENNR